VGGKSAPARADHAGLSDFVRKIHRIYVHRTSR
jgi:hypothetical protein